MNKAMKPTTKQGQPMFHRQNNNALMQQNREYMNLFIKAQAPETPASKGKLAYLTAEDHERITRIIAVIGKGKKVNIATYLHFVLKHHFEQYEDSIRYLYNENYRNVF